MKLLSTMVTEEQIHTVLEYLNKSIKVEGDVVELGCNVGTTSVFIQETLKSTGKKFHVYDSFEGLPEKTEYDISDIYKKGSCKTAKETFIKNFEGELPIIHEGWFKEAEYPDKICFAFFDGDFYTSIMDSFKMVYPRMTKGGYILVHDYQWNKLPGVEKACDDFLKTKLINKDYIGILKI